MPEPRAYSIRDACIRGAFGRSRCYQLIAAKVLDARKEGVKTVITAESLDRYCDNRPPADIGAGRRNRAAPAPDARDGG